MVLSAAVAARLVGTFSAPVHRPAFGFQVGTARSTQHARGPPIPPPSWSHVLAGPAPSVPLTSPERQIVVPSSLPADRANCRTCSSMRQEPRPKRRRGRLRLSVLASACGPADAATFREQVQSSRASRNFFSRIAVRGRLPSPVEGRPAAQPRGARSHAQSVLLGCGTQNVEAMWPMDPQRPPCSGVSWSKPPSRHAGENARSPARSVARGGRGRSWTMTRLRKMCRDRGWIFP